jgi:hypothetical protein
MARSLRTAIATAAMVATISLLASSEAAQQEEEKERIFHKRHIPNRPDRPVRNVSRELVFHNG